MLSNVYNSIRSIQKLFHAKTSLLSLFEVEMAASQKMANEPFHDIDPMVKLDDEGVDFNQREVCNLNESQLAKGCSYKNEDYDESSSESESEYDPADDFERNVFDAY